MAYSKTFGNRYVYTRTDNTRPTDHLVADSMRSEPTCIRVEVEVPELLSAVATTSASDYKDKVGWDTLQDDFDAAVADPSILLDQVRVPQDNCYVLTLGIRNSTASIVSDGLYDESFPIGPAGALAVVLAQSITCSCTLYAKGGMGYW